MKVSCFIISAGFLQIIGIYLDFFVFATGATYNLHIHSPQPDLTTVTIRPTLDIGRSHASIFPAPYYKQKHADYGGNSIVSNNSEWYIIYKLINVLIRQLKLPTAIVNDID